MVLGGRRPGQARRATRGSRGSRRARPTAGAGARSAAARARPASWRARADRPPRSARAAPAASAWISSTSPSSSWIALSCWRRKNSRWPLSISDSTCDWILRADRDQLELAGEQLGEAAQPLRHVELLEQLLALLGLDPQRPGDHVRQLGRVLEVGHRDLQLLGQVGHLLDDLREGGLHVAEQRLELGRGLDQVGQLGDLRAPGRARAARTRRSAPAGSRGPGCAACRRAP